MGSQSDVPTNKRNAAPGQKSRTPVVGDGRQGRGRGRVPVAGRSLVSTDGRPTPQMVHSSSGVPFGHVPAYLPGAASLVEELDKRLLVLLRDGRHMIGTLSSFDQFSNLVLTDTIERVVASVNEEGVRKQFYADIPVGIYIVRGDSMVLAGELHDDAMPMAEEITIEEFDKLKAEPSIDWDFDGDLIA